MKYFILLINIVFSASAFAEYEFITTNEDLDEIYFIDLSTLDILKDNHKTVQVLINYQNGFITENDSVAFSALEEITVKVSDIFCRMSRLSQRSALLAAIINGFAFFLNDFKK